jgi:hypothetical protein
MRLEEEEEEEESRIAWGLVWTLLHEHQISGEQMKTSPDTPLLSTVHQV